MTEQTGIWRSGPREIAMTIKITGNVRALWQFRATQHDWAGTVLIESEWSVGEPVAYAPHHHERETFTDTEKAAARAAELMRLPPLVVIGQ